MNTVSIVTVCYNEPNLEDTCKSMCPSGDVFSIDDESGTCYCTDGTEISI